MNNNFNLSLEKFIESEDFPCDLTLNIHLIFLQALKGSEIQLKANNISHSLIYFNIIMIFSISSSILVQKIRNYLLKEIIHTKYMNLSTQYTASYALSIRPIVDQNIDPRMRFWIKTINPVFKGYSVQENPNS